MSADVVVACNLMPRTRGVESLVVDIPVVCPMVVDIPSKLTSTRLQDIPISLLFCMLYELCSRCVIVDCAILQTVKVNAVLGKALRVQNSKITKQQWKKNDKHTRGKLMQDLAIPKAI